MPTAELWKVLGFATPFVYASAAFQFFRLLDRRASDPARRAILDWVESKQQSNRPINDAILELFNRVYTSRLGSWSAFIRSSAFTILMSAIFIYEFYDPYDVSTQLVASGYVFDFTLALSTNVFSDYLGLFAVKYFLIEGRTHPILALLGGATAGMATVALFLLLQTLVLSLYYYPLNPADLTPDYLGFFLFGSSGTFRSSLWLSLVAAAMVVHLWLPVAFLSAAMLKGLSYLKVTIGWVQWFLRSGRKHPLEAIGYVAAAFVFVVSVTVQAVWR